MHNYNAIILMSIISNYIGIISFTDIHVSFERSMYIINEGNFLEQLFINASHSRDDVQLEIYESKLLH